jgi:hypothetical protein
VHQELLLQSQQRIEENTRRHMDVARNRVGDHTLRSSFTVWAIVFKVCMH